MAAAAWTTPGGGLNESYGYTRGRMTRVLYPYNEASYTYSYDTMGRLNEIVNAQSGQLVV